MIPTALASRHEIDVATTPERAFEVFTAGLGSWWSLGDHHVGAAPAVDAVIEPGAGGFWGEIAADGTRSPWGTVLEWEPPQRVLLAWSLDTDFRYDPGVRTEVEVTFTATGDGGTRVEFEHRLGGFGEAAQRMQQLFDGPNAWGFLLERFAETAAA